MRAMAAQGCTLFVGNLPYDLSADALFGLVAVVAPTTSASLAEKSGRSLGYGFVELHSADDVRAAVARLNTARIGGRSIIVKPAAIPAALRGQLRTVSGTGAAPYERRVSLCEANGDHADAQTHALPSTSCGDLITRFSAASLALAKSGASAANADAVRACASSAFAALVRGVAGPYFAVGDTSCRDLRLIGGSSNEGIESLARRAATTRRVMTATPPDVPFPALFVPVASGKGGMDSVYVARGGDGGFPQDVLSSVDMLAEHAGAALASVAARVAEGERRTMSENMLSLLEDVYRELDSRVLTAKLLAYASHLVSADRCSLFLVDETADELYAEVFDGDNGASGGQGEQRIRFPRSKGIAGYVARTGEPLNIPDAYADARFNQEVDRATGYRTRSILCLPIRNQHSAVIGVAQLVNKASGAFTVEDERLFARFLLYCGIALQHARAFELERAVIAEHEVLLSVARGVFGHLDVDSVLNHVMATAALLVRAERCSVFLVDAQRQELYARVFEVGSLDANVAAAVARRDSTDEAESEGLKKGPPREVRFPIAQGIAGYVARTGETLNIRDAYSDPRFNRDIDRETGFTTRTILCVPIVLGDGEVIGVTQLLNKAGNVCFTPQDERLLRCFSVFCGIAIKNAQLFDKAIENERRARLVLEVMSYHAKAPEEDVALLAAAAPAPASSFGVDRFTCDPRGMPWLDQCRAVEAMFREFGFLEHYRVPVEVFRRFVLTVRRNYRQVLYHNWDHAFEVTQTCYALMKSHTAKLAGALRRHELFGMLVAVLVHDIDHRGVNNSFLRTAEGELWSLYGDSSILEKHHFSHFVTLVSCDTLNIFQGLTSQEAYKNMLDHIKACIMHTDIANHFVNRNEFKAILAETNGVLDRKSSRHRRSLSGMIMTAADISAITKPWEQQSKVAQLVYGEFFDQGDRESRMGTVPLEMMDRHRASVPKLQLGFIDYICLPCFELLARYLENSQPMVDGVRANRAMWQRIYDEELARGDAE